MKIYEIPFAIRDALDRIEVDEETGEILNADALREAEAQAAEKLEATALYVRELQAEAKAIKVEADRMKARAEALEKKSETLKHLMLEALPAVGGKVKTPSVTVFIRMSKAIEVADGVTLPDAFVTVRTTTTPNKTALKEAIEAGADIEGVRLVERESVQIK